MKIGLRNKLTAISTLLMDEIEYIAENPESGRDYIDIRKGYFRSRVKSHFIFYRINPKKKEVEIIRILHQQMDITTNDPKFNGVDGKVP